MDWKLIFQPHIVCVLHARIIVPFSLFRPFHYCCVNVCTRTVQIQKSTFRLFDRNKETENSTKFEHFNHVNGIAYCVSRFYCCSACRRFSLLTTFFVISRKITIIQNLLRSTLTFELVPVSAALIYWLQRTSTVQVTILLFYIFTDFIHIFGHFMMFMCHLYFSADNMQSFFALRKILNTRPTIR